MKMMLILRNAPLLVPLCFVSLISFSAQAKERVVSIGGNVTEVIYALGKQDLIVGTDTTSNYPPEATTTAKVGYSRQLSAEGILSLQPTVVFATEEAGPALVLDQLESAGVNVQILPTQFDVDGAIEKVKAISTYLKAEQEGDALISQIKSRVTDAQSVINNHQGDTPKILFVLGMRSGNLMVSGQGTQANGIIKLVGGYNPMTQFNSYKPLTPEQIVEVMPDVILMMSRGDDRPSSMDTIQSNPVLKLTPAVKNNKVIYMNGSYLLGFGPRVGDAMRELAEQVYD